MPLTFNLRHLEKNDLDLEGDLASEELELADVDELIRLPGPVHYRLKVERLSDSVLVRGRLHCPLECQCVRCLTPFEGEVDLPEWTLDLPLEGEDKVPVTNDSVDLTPYVREDILLAFPQHPLCEAGCPGLLEAARSRSDSASFDKNASSTSSAWSELNKLKF